MTVGPDMAVIAAVIAATMACWALVPSGGGSAHTAQVRVFELSELRLLSAQAPAGEKPAGSPPQLLLVIVGDVYDVSADREFYAPGGGYEGFVYQDVSRAFLTADFENNATDDLDDLLPGQCLGIEHWQSFYRDHAKYTFVGRLHGRFYDAYGEPTEARSRFHACAAQGVAARSAARTVAVSATPCSSTQPMGEARFNVGRWVTYTCVPPEVPRRMTLQDSEGQTCICLHPGAASAGGFEPTELGMEEDPHLPQVYGHQADPTDHTITIRLG